VRLIADVEAVRPMAAAVRQQEGPDGDRERLERRRTTIAGGLAGQDARDVGLHWHRRHGVAAAGTGKADADRSGVERRPLNP
jgi:hypothetical protein